MPTLQNPADSEIKSASALMPKHRRINYMCHKVNIITQMLSQPDTYPDDPWGLSHDFTSAPPRHFARNEPHSSGQMGSAPSHS